MKKTKTLKYLLCSLLAVVVYSCTNNSGNINYSMNSGVHTIETPEMIVTIGNRMQLKVSQKVGEKKLSIIKDGNEQHYAVINGSAVTGFNVDENETEWLDINNEFGPGKRLQLTGSTTGPENSEIHKILYIDFYEQFPNAAVINSEYINKNSTPGLVINGEVSNKFLLDASLANAKSKPNDFWILQGGSYTSRPDWILPVTDTFSFSNYQGRDIENEISGGGLPVLDVWSKETGFFIGSMNDKPIPISLPAKTDEHKRLNISIEYEKVSTPFETKPYKSIPTVIGVHSGDFYDGLTTYSKLMERKGFEMMKNDPDASVYDAIWCAWGFGPDFTREQMIDMIPLLKEMNYKVVTVDYGWFYKQGDFFPRDDTFPNGDESMKEFVKVFHDNGFKIKLWIIWNLAGPVVAEEHPEWLARDKDGNPYLLSNQWADSYYLCPAVEEVQEFHRELTRKYIGEWGFDGFKEDQQFMNAVSECYAEEHGHSSPYDALAAHPYLTQIVQEEALKYKPEAILEVCPCGVFPSFYKMPYYNQPISSDFNSEWQIRHRGKVIKSLMGPLAAYYGDHAERHYSEMNLPSMIGVGGIPGTMFVKKPEDNVEFLRVKYPGYLSPERRKHFDKWFGLYNEYKLGNGEYRNLYDLAFDKPETHAIEKNGILYYSFFADEWSGNIQFRGLEEKEYKIIDYVNEKELGSIKGNKSLNLKFKNYLFVKAVPVGS